MMTYRAFTASSRQPASEVNKYSSVQVEDRGNHHRFYRYILCASYLVNLVRVYQNNQVGLAQNSVRLSAVALVNPR